MEYTERGLKNWEEKLLKDYKVYTEGRAENIPVVTDNVVHIHMDILGRIRMKSAVQRAKT